MKPKSEITIIQAFKKSLLSFVATLPLLLGVILLIGGVQTLVSQEMLASLFGHGALIDALSGTLLGAIASGNPSIGYVAGGELLAQGGVSLFAVTAFLLVIVITALVNYLLKPGQFVKHLHY